MQTILGIALHCAALCSVRINTDLSSLQQQNSYDVYAYLLKALVIIGHESL